MTPSDVTFSVIVNTVDRVRPLSTLLHALEQQSYRHFEVVVVVGPTHDSTLGMLAEWGDRVRVLRCPTANLSESRNIGLRAASGEIVAFIDDDAIPTYHWLAQLARLFQDPDLSGTGGKVHFVRPGKGHVQHQLGIVSGLAEQVDKRASWHADLPPAGHSFQWVARMMGTNMAYRRQDLLEVGGFDEFFQWVYDDSDLALRLVDAGKMVHPVQEAVVYHAPAPSRNREVSTAIGNWWIQTKAGIYFAFRHGRRGGNSWSDVINRSLHLWHGHLLWYRHLRQSNKITRQQQLKMQFQETRGALSGFYHGWRRSREPETANAVVESRGESEGFQLFQNDRSRLQPTVDPVSGTRPTITMPEPPLRVALLSGAYPPEQYEGVGRHTNLMAQGLFELGHTVHVIARGETELTTFYEGAFVHRVPHDTGRYERYQLFPRTHHMLNYSHAVHDKVRQLVLNDGAQLVDSPLWQMDGLVTAVSGTVPVVLRIQTATTQIADIQRENSNDAQLLTDLERTFVKHADHLVPNSRASVRTVHEVYQIDVAPDNYTIIPHGIVPAPEEEVRPFPAEAPPDVLTVLYVGRLEKRKGIRDLFAAIPAVLSAVQNVRFVIVGADNSHQDGFQKGQGMDYATYFAHTYPQYARSVTFTGAVSDEVLQRHYQACDLFVAPSLYESFGLIYLEAMNYAKPVIGCNSGGVPEVVADGYDGLLVEPESPGQLAEAIVKLLKSPAKLREMGLAGRQRLLDEFTYVAMAARFADAYRRVIASERS